MDTAELKARMQAKAEAVQTVVVTISTLEEALDYAVALTRRQQGKSMVVLGFPDDLTAEAASRCKAAGLSLPHPPLRAVADGIHTALTTVDWGIAETGTLVLDSRSEDVRLATMLAETHVAVLPAGRIRPDTESLTEVLQRSLAETAPAYTAFITGASRTADIERVLAVGVHGPQELHILIMEETPR